MSAGEKNLSKARLSELIELALSDKVSFNAIKDEFGLKGDRSKKFNAKKP